MTLRKLLTAALAAAVLFAAGCGGDAGGPNQAAPDSSASAETTEESTAPTATEQVVVPGSGDGFNAAQIFQRAAPGVVTIVSIFGGDSADPASLKGGQGSGFVVSANGEIMTNTHVVTDGFETGGGGKITLAHDVFVQFADGNRVTAEIVGIDPDADLALIKVDPDGLDLQPLTLSQRNDFTEGEPVAAIGSPFGEDQSLSVGIVSATGRTIESLSRFAIDEGIQTDASINPGNSGGPLLDSKGEVIGVNQQILSNSGSDSGVGFAIPVTAVRYSLEQLREDGSVEYAYIGLTTTVIWPQLADELGLGSSDGALVSEVVSGSPADKAGLRGSNDEITFQSSSIPVGGDLIVAIDGEKLTADHDLVDQIDDHRPGQTITLELLNDGETREVDVTLGTRPEGLNP